MKTVEIFVDRGRLKATLDGDEEISLGFLLSCVGKASGPYLVHFPSASRAIEVDFKIVTGGFGLRLSRFGRGKLQLRFNRQLVEMVRVQVDFGKLGPITALMPKGVLQLRVNNAMSEKMVRIRKVKRKERQREERQAARPIEEIPPGPGQVRLYINEKNIPMLRTAFQAVGLTKQLKHAANGSSVSVAVHGCQVAELQLTSKPRTFELRGVGGTEILIAKESSMKALVVLRENGRAEKIELA